MISLWDFDVASKNKLHIGNTARMLRVLTYYTRAKFV